MITQEVSSRDRERSDQQPTLPAAAQHVGMSLCSTVCRDTWISTEQASSGTGSSRAILVLCPPSLITQLDCVAHNLYVFCHKQEGGEKSFLTHLCQLVKISILLCLKELVDKLLYAYAPRRLKDRVPFVEAMQYPGSFNVWPFLYMAMFLRGIGMGRQETRVWNLSQNLSWRSKGNWKINR